MVENFIIACHLMFLFQLFHELFSFHQMYLTLRAVLWLVPDIELVNT